jgi:hypothetical protein
VSKGKVIDLFGDAHSTRDSGQESSTEPYVDAPQVFYDDINSMMSDFNRFFIQALIGNQPSVIWEHDDKYTIFSYEQFNKQFSYSKIPNQTKGKVEYVKATHIWLGSPTKRRVPGIKFWPNVKANDPNDPDNKLFNTWKTGRQSLLKIRRFAESF